MKPVINISTKTLESGDLCNILLNARSAMINTAVRAAHNLKKPAFEVGLARMDADREALEMSKRCMYANSMKSALEIIQEYVDIMIV